MSSTMVMVLVIFPLFIPAVRPSGGLWDLDCLPTVGIVAQTTVINCSFRGISISDIEIVAVNLRKIIQNEPRLEDIYEENIYDKKKSGDKRFSLKTPAMSPSLQFSDTMSSDEGKYLYKVVTDSGPKELQISINVTAKYQNPTTSTWPQDIPDGGPVNLYCNATDGYPAGFIHWFDHAGTNWTINSDLTKATKDINGLKYVALSSKLTFKSIDLGLAPFRCIVLNSKYVQEGESTLLSKTSKYNSKESSPSNTTNIVAGVMVIGSLIAGLLFALFVFRKRGQHGRRPSAHPILSYESANNAGDDQETGNITHSHKEQSHHFTKA